MQYAIIDPFSIIIVIVAIANMFGFEPRSFFDVDPTSREVPSAKF